MGLVRGGRGWEVRSGVGGEVCTAEWRCFNCKHITKLRPELRAMGICRCPEKCAGVAAHHEAASDRDAWELLNHDTKAYAADNGRCMTPDFGDQSGADNGAVIGAVAAGAVLGAEVTGHAAHHLKKDSTCPGAAPAGAGLDAEVRNRKNLGNSNKNLGHSNNRFNLWV